MVKREETSRSDNGAHSIKCLTFDKIPGGLRVHLALSSSASEGYSAICFELVLLEREKLILTSMFSMDNARNDMMNDNLLF